MSESYRAIRTALLLSQADKPPQVVLFTSPSPGEGKTVSSINLAIALAHDGHSVLLIDGDMRMGCCHSRFGLRNNRGLSNVLTGGLALKDGIQPTPVSGLSLLSRGVLPPNPSELLGSRKMKEILDDLRQTFDFILIDSPPVMGISDATILSVVVDGVLLVFNSQSTSTAYAQKTVERLDMVHARLLGVILNAVNLDDPHYSYYRSYSTYYQLPNGNKSPGEAHEDAVREPYEPVERLSKILEAAAARRTNEELDQASGEKRNSHPANSGGMDWLNSSASTPGIGMTGRFESHSGAATDGLDKPVNHGRTQSWRVVPEKFMNRLIDVLMDSIGPVAPLVVRDHIASLGESPDAFPQSRMDELVESIAPEILHGELRSRFRRKISEEIRDLAD
jgi:capsular exopolysaccharide synthesis family protein